MSNKRNNSKLTKKAVSKMIDKKLNDNIETKQFTRYLDVTANSTGNVQVLSYIVQGLDSYQRVGDKIKVLSIQFKYSLYPADIYNKFRVIIFRDFSKASGIPAPVLTGGGGEALLQTTGDDGTVLAAQDYYLALPKSDNRSRYKILYDKIHDISGSNANSYNIPYTMTRKGYIKKNMVVEFAGSSATSNSKGTLYLGVISDSTAVNHPEINFHCKLSFQDA